MSAKFILFGKLAVLLAGGAYAAGSWSQLSILYERLFVIAVYAVFIVSFLLRTALISLGVFAIYRMLWRAFNSRNTYDGESILV